MKGALSLVFAESGFSYWEAAQTNMKAAVYKKGTSFFINREETSHEAWIGKNCAFEKNALHYSVFMI